MLRVVPWFEFQQVILEVNYVEKEDNKIGSKR